MANFVVKFTDNSNIVLSALNANIDAALEEVGLRVESYAINNAPVGNPQSTGVVGYKGGSLRNSITHKIVGNSVFVGTNIKSKEGYPYAIAVEFGTGIHADNGNGRKSPWAYKDKNGDWHWTRGIKPTHFLRNAVTGHNSEYINVIKKNLKGK